jgi:ribosomal protein S12 methylthiotransferase
MDGTVPEEIRQQRRNLVMEHQMAVSTELNQLKTGRDYEVMIDEVMVTDADPDGSYMIYSGRTRYDSPEIDCAVTFSGAPDLSPGDIVNVIITNAFEYDLEGEQVL